MSEQEDGENGSQSPKKKAPAKFKKAKREADGEDVKPAKVS